MNSQKVNEWPKWGSDGKSYGNDSYNASPRRILMFIVKNRT